MRRTYRNTYQRLQSCAAPQGHYHTGTAVSHLSICCDVLPRDWRGYSDLGDWVIARQIVRHPFEGCSSNVPSLETSGERHQHCGTLGKTAPNMGHGEDLNLSRSATPPHRAFCVIIYISSGEDVPQQKEFAGGRAGRVDCQ
jgi:hypothetical protein